MSKIDLNNTYCDITPQHYKKLQELYWDKRSLFRNFEDIDNDGYFVITFNGNKLSFSIYRSLHTGLREIKYDNNANNWVYIEQ